MDTAGPILAWRIAGMKNAWQEGLPRNYGWIRMTESEALWG